MNFNDLDLSIKEQTRTVNINDKEIQVKEYLPIEDKQSLIQITLQQSEVNGLIDYILLDAYFGLYTVMYYTDLEFTDEEKSEPLKLYDILESNGIIDEVFNYIPIVERDQLQNCLDSTIEKIIPYKNSLAYSFNNLINNFGGLLSNLNEYDVKNIMEQIQNNLINNVDENKNTIAET